MTIEEHAASKTEWFQRNHKHIGSKSMIEISTPPSLLPVGGTVAPDWALRRHKGNQVRYQNTRNGAWDRKFSLEPGDVLYRELDPTLYTPEPAPETAAERMSDDIGQSSPEADVEYAYESMTRDQLRKIASERKIAGRGTMTKDQLITALRG